MKTFNGTLDGQTNPTLNRLHLMYNVIRAEEAEI